MAGRREKRDDVKLDPLSSKRLLCHIKAASYVTTCKRHRSAHYFCQQKHEKDKKVCPKTGKKLQKRQKCLKSKNKHIPIIFEQMTITEQETRKAVAEFMVTKIQGQPRTKDIDRLDEELTAIASSFLSELGGGAHGHAGLIKSAADYALFAPATPFVVPANPGHYPTGPIPAVQRMQQEAEHTALIVQFQTCTGVAKGLKDLILQAVDEDFLLELHDEGVAYLNVTPFQMLTHLRDRWDQWIMLISPRCWPNAIPLGMQPKSQQSTLTSR